MAHACQDHVEQMREEDYVGYIGTDGSTPYTRMSKYGKVSPLGGANLYRGSNTGVEIVMYFLVDDGNNKRGSRAQLFRAEGVTGIFSGPQATYGYMSCINYADTYENNEEQNQLDAQHADEDQ